MEKFEFKEKRFDGELDNQLYKEFVKDNPSEEQIRELVAKGANVNAIDNSDESLLIKVMFYIISPEMKIHRGEGLDIKYIKLLIDLGVDVNYAQPGEYNCLFDAQNVWNPELVEMLLKAGANPNTFSEEEGFTLLDWVTQDQAYEEQEYNNGDRGGKEPLIKIVALLKQYGAKTTRQLMPERYK